MCIIGASSIHYILYGIHTFISLSSSTSGRKPKKTFAEEAIKLYEIKAHAAQKTQQSPPSSSKALFSSNIANTESDQQGKKCQRVKYYIDLEKRGENTKNSTRRLNKKKPK